MDGTLVTGQGVGAEFVGATQDTLAAAVGFRPYPGTLNLAEVDGIDRLPRRVMDDDLGDPHCSGVHLRPCTVDGVLAAIIRPQVPDYPEDKVELLAPVRLRSLFRLDEMATVSLTLPDEAWRPEGHGAAPEALDEFDAVVFDLDGTLVDLAVDWGSVHDAIEAQFGRYLDRPVREHSQNELFEVATTHGVFDDLADMLRDHEVDGAGAADALGGVHALSALSGPVGIVTANAVEAAERALDRFDVRGAVDVIVGRETVRPGKPEPDPLLACLDRLDAAPGNALFVGNDPVDAETAVRSGTSFLHVDQLWPTD